ncbi:hypothetical protein [Mycolicibacterium setense]
MPEAFAEVGKHRAHTLQRGDHCRVIGVGSLGCDGRSFDVIHVCLDLAAGRPVSARTTRDYRAVNSAFALIGVAGTLLGTIGGVLITQLMPNRRETAAWEREVKRERARCEREDRARTFEFRREAYVGYFRAVADESMESWQYIIDVHVDGEERELPHHSAVQDAADLLVVYGSPRVRDLAEAARKKAWEFRREATKPDLDLGPEINQLQDRVDVALSKLLDAIRDELGVPTGTVSTSVTGA